MKIQHAPQPQLRTLTQTPTPPQQPQQPDEPQDSLEPQKPQPPEKYPLWTPLANAGVVGALVGVPSALGALEHSLFGPVAAGVLTGVVTPVVAGLAAGTWAYKSSKKEFKGHPILVGMSTLVAGGAAALISPLLKAPGATYGWQGALVATGVAAGAVGIISAVGIYKANQKIDQQQ